MPRPGLKNRSRKQEVRSKNLNIKSEVEWYSGKDSHTHPKRIEINGVWEEVFYYEKRIRENKITHKREIVFRCHIGDNRIIEIVNTYVLTK